MRCPRRKLSAPFAAYGAASLSRRCTPTPLSPPTIAQRCYAPLRRMLDFAAALTLLIVSSPIVAAGRPRRSLQLARAGVLHANAHRRAAAGRSPSTRFAPWSTTANRSLGPRWTMPGDPRITADRLGAPPHTPRRIAPIAQRPQGRDELDRPAPERPEFVESWRRRCAGLRQPPHRLARHHRPGPDAAAARYRRRQRSPQAAIRPVLRPAL